MATPVAAATPAPPAPQQGKSQGKPPRRKTLWITISAVVVIIVVVAAVVVIAVSDSGSSHHTAAANPPAGNQGAAPGHTHDGGHGGDSGGLLLSQGSGGVSLLGSGANGLSLSSGRGGFASYPEAPQDGATIWATDFFPAATSDDSTGLYVYSVASDRIILEASVNIYYDDAMADDVIAAVDWDGDTQWTVARSDLPAADPDDGFSCYTMARRFGCAIGSMNGGTLLVSIDPASGEYDVVPLDMVVHFRGVFGDSIIAVDDSQEHVLSIDPLTGEQHWKSGSNDLADVSIVGDVVVAHYFDTYGDDATAILDPSTGQRVGGFDQWINSPDGSTWYGAADEYYSDGSSASTGSSGSAVGVAAYDLDGTKRWEYDTGTQEHVFGAPDNIVLVHSDGGATMTALDATSGTVDWQIPWDSDSDYYWSSRVVDGLIFASNYDAEQTTAIDAATGEIQFRADGYYLAGDGHRAYTYSDDASSLAAYDLSTGDTVWRTSAYQYIGNGSDPTVWANAGHLIAYILNDPEAVMVLDPTG